ncbi:MAG: hypothetical protein J6T59_02835, partial [Bacteroidales bacterium]|nr:hypothetical protein [Bacteroidales bacterium]
MKKTLTFLGALLFLTASVTMGQTPNQTNTQFPNPGFEKWVAHSGAHPYDPILTNYGYITDLPYNWHTFDEANATIVGASTAKKTHHKRSSGYKNDYAISIYCATVLGIPANGAISTGQTMIGSTTAGSSSNYNYSNPNQSSSYAASGSMTWEFIGCPDTMSFYYKTSYTNQDPLFKVFLHKNGEFRDRANGTLYGGSDVKLIGSSVDTFSTSSSWKREVYPFTYSTPGQGGTEYSFLGQNSSLHPVYGYYTSLNRPDLMLASFSTSKTAGTGSNQDHLDIDELWCIYDKGLSSLTINGTQNNTAKNYFNAQEYLTHEPARTYDGNGNPSFNNSGSASWNYTNLVCYTSDSDFPQIDARPKSKLITNFVITQATMANHQATITVTHNDNSTYTYTIVFTNAHPKPTVTLNNGGTYTACAGVQIDVTASGASSYEWSNNLGNTATVHPTASGQYTVTGTSSGCSANAIAYVTVNERPEVKINGAVSGTASICSGNNATLTASGATTYQWSNNLGSATSINVSTGGTYTVTGTANGCSNTASVTVTAYDAPTVTINGSANGSTTACSTDAITLTASGASTYVWANNLGTNPAIQPPMSNSGDYTVTGTDSHGCTASATHHLTVNTTPTVNITGTTAICEGTSTTLTATSDWENTIFQWSNNLGTNAAVLVSAGGIYTVTGTKDGCSSSATVTVTESSLPDAPTVTPASRCGAGTVTLTVSSNEGTIHWYASETTQSESGTGTSFTTPNINNNTTYYVEVHSDAGCKSARVPVTATVNALPNVTATSAATNNAVCAGSSTTLTANGASSYVWSTNETGTTITVTPTANTTTYNVTGTGANGCENTATVTVTVNPVPGVPTPGQTTYCKGTTNVTLEATAGENGNALRWRTSPTGNATQGANYSANAVGTYYVSTYNTTNQCESEQV